MLTRLWPLVRLAVLLLAITACSTGADDSLADLTPPNSWTSDEQAVIDTYARFRSELTEVTKSMDGDLDRVLVLATPRLGEGLTETVTGQRSVGDLIDGSYSFVPLDVSFDVDEEAQLFVCSWDQTYVNNEGEQLTEIPDGPTTATVDLHEQDDGTWLVNGIFETEGIPCEL